MSGATMTLVMWIGAALVTACYLGAFVAWWVRNR